MLHTTVIKSYNNTNVLNPLKTNKTKPAEICNHQINPNCMLNKNMLEKLPSYNAPISSEYKKHDYYRSTITAHFWHQFLEKSTKLSKQVWEHKNKGHLYQIQWSVIKQATPY